MSLTVKDNKNGTLTISCGDESITIGDPSPPPANTVALPPPIRDPSSDRTSIVAGDDHPTEIVTVPSIDQLPDVLRAMHGKYALSQAPVMLQLLVKADKPLIVGSIKKELAEVSKLSGMRTQIKFTGRSDD